MTPAGKEATSPSQAQQLADEQAAVFRALVAASAAATNAALPHARLLLPPGWHAGDHQTISGATHTVAIDPPAGMVDATAYLIPDTDETDGPVSGLAVSGWLVRVHDRRQRVDFPLYTDGGARAAVFTGVADAIAATVAALRVQAVPMLLGVAR